VLRGAAVWLAWLLSASPAVAQSPPDPTAASASVQTVLVSRVGLTGPAADEQSFQAPTISRDGRYIAFFSLSSNLTPDDIPGPQVFRKDTVTGDMVLVSRDENGMLLGAGWPRMSTNGAHICFFSGASGGPTRLYVRDVAAGTSRVVPGTGVVNESNEGTGSGPIVDGTGHACGVSDDGQTVVYSTSESHDPADSNGLLDVYRYSFASGTWDLASRASGTAGAVGDGYSRNPTMTPDGRYVVFWSRAANLASGDTNSFTDVFRRDMVTGTTELGSAVDGGSTTASGPITGPNSSSLNADHQTDPVITDDGRYVAFTADAPLVAGVQGGPVQCMVRDLVNQTTTVISRKSGLDGKPVGYTAGSSCGDPSISSDGHYVAFDSFGALDPNANTTGADGRAALNIYIRDMVGARTALVTRATGVFGDPGDGFSFGPSISNDAGRVAFVSQAENFSPDDTALGDVFYRDTVGILPDLPADVPGEPALEKARPVLSSPARGGRKATGITAVLSEWARDAKLVVQLCRKTKHKHCARWTTKATLTPGLVQEGVNRLALNPGKTLRKGSYRVKATAVDLANEVGKTVASFKFH
jgi:Tol biopolymer transport system component